MQDQARVLQRVRSLFEPVADGGEQMQLAEVPRVLDGARRQRALRIVGLDARGRAMRSIAVRKSSVSPRARGAADLRWRGRAP